MRNTSNKNTERNKKRAFKEHLVSGVYAVIYAVILIYGVLGIAIDISHATNTAVGMLFLAAVVWLYGKNSDISNQARFDEEYKKRECLFYAHKFTQYKGECISNVELVDTNKIQITLVGDFYVEINVNYLLKLKDTCDYEMLDDFISKKINDPTNKNIPQSAQKISLEISIQNYLEKLP